MQSQWGTLVPPYLPFPWSHSEETPMGRFSRTRRRRGYAFPRCATLYRGGAEVASFTDFEGWYFRFRWSNFTGTGFKRSVPSPSTQVPTITPLAPPPERWWPYKSVFGDVSGSGTVRVRVIG